MYGTFSISVGLMPMTTHMWIRKKQWKNHLKRSSKRYVRLIISQLLDKYVLHISLNPFSSGVIFYRISRQMSEFHIRSLGSKHAIDLHTERSSPLDRQHLRTQFSVATSKIPLVTQTKIFNSPTRENYDRWKTRPQFTWRHENPYTHKHTVTIRKRIHPEENMFDLGYHRGYNASSTWILSSWAYVDMRANQTIRTTSHCQA